MRNKARHLVVAAESKKWPAHVIRLRVMMGSEGRRLCDSCLAAWKTSPLAENFGQGSSKESRVWPVGVIAIGLLENLKWSPTVWGSCVILISPCQPRRRDISFRHACRTRQYRSLVSVAGCA
jgi:hypothetical protein